MTCLFLDNFDYINRVDDVNEKLSGPKQSIKITNVLNPMSAIAYLDYFQKVLRWWIREMTVPKNTFIT